MSISFSASMTGADDVAAALLGLSKGGALQAFATALNDTGHLVRGVMQQEMRRSFDRPTPYILSSPRFKKATPSKLGVTVEPTYMGGKGVDPQKILQAQQWGGTRVDKRSEVLLRRKALLPDGYQTVIPARPYPGSTDNFGNISGGFLTYLLSYLSAMAEQGYRANMTAAGRAKVHRGGGGKAGRRFFVSYGKGPMGYSRPTKAGGRDKRVSHLPSGIWAAAGVGGAIVVPVLLFVKKGHYKPRFTMEKVADQASIYTYFQSRVRYRFRQAAGV